MAEKKAKGLIYSVQEHHASHLHWDLRLERDGVLKSWAVPKGIPLDDSKRLAVEVPDHEISYAFFEGNLPEGEYGAGKVEVWDRGTYEPIVWESNKIEVEIKGKKVKGRYELVRTMMSGNPKNWLIFKKKEKVAAKE